jgi:hypothetical protein
MEYEKEIDGEKPLYWVFCTMWTDSVSFTRAKEGSITVLLAQDTTGTN